MKKLFVLLAVLILCIGGASALSLTFQSPGDFIQQVTYMQRPGSWGTGSAAWVQSTVGGNSYIHVTEPKTSIGGIRNSQALATTYAAITCTAYDGTTNNAVAVVLLDAAGNELWFSAYSVGSQVGRWELKVSGGTAYFYLNGVLRDSHAITQNPSYVMFGMYNSDIGGSKWVELDDYVYGATENKYIFDSPEVTKYIIYKDLVNPAAGGFAKADGTVVNSQLMPYSWARGNNGIPPNALSNENINLVNYGTGVIYNTSTTGTAYYGSGNFNIYDAILNNSAAPQGYYAITIPGSGKYSDVIQYMSNGATVTWGQKLYSQGDTASIIHYVSSGGYWNTSGYIYKIAVMDIWMNFYGTNSTVTTQSGNTSFAWTSSMNPGVYYAEMIATDKLTGKEYYMGDDYTTLSSYVNFAGWVNNAETQSVISGANVSIVQGATIANTLSATDGNYTAVGFLTGGSTTVNITKTGYRRYAYTFTPMVARTIALNFTLIPNSPSFSGIALGGVDRDIIYGRPISGASIAVTNTTTGEYYVKTTNSVGYYLCDAGSACTLASPQVYSVWGSKLHYSNSTTYQVVTV